MDDVRKLINHLIEKGYDKKIPQRRSEQEVLISYEVAAKLVLIVENVKSQLDEASSLIERKIDILNCLISDFRFKLQPYMNTISLPSKSPRRADSLGLDFDSIFHAFDSIDTDEMVDISIDYGQIDSDEEAKLYDELDNLMEAQERAIAFKGNANKFMANAFQKMFLRIQDLEDSFELVRRSCLLPSVCSHSIFLFAPLKRSLQ